MNEQDTASHLKFGGEGACVHSFYRPVDIP